MYEKIPQELKALKQWVCWKAVQDENRPNKIKKLPINAVTGGSAMSNNSDTWCSFDTALKQSQKYSGIGFMFANGYFGVDIDNIEDAINAYKAGDSDNIVSEFIYTLGSYAEYSVSQKGIHVICRGSLPPRGRRKNNVEMYEAGRFFIMTGNSASEFVDVVDCTTKIKILHEKYIGGGSEPVTPPIDMMTVLSEHDIVNAATNSKQGAAFLELYQGNWNNGFFQSQSEADMSFCNMLAFWCGKDEMLMDSVFRSSGLMRPKWDRKQSGSTYGKLTINKAIKNCSAVYEPMPDYDISIGGSPAPKKRLYSFDDTGNAQRFVDTFGEKTRYSYVNKSWFYYDGRKWCTDITGAIKRMADKVVDDMRYDLDFYIENSQEDSDINDMEKRFLKHVKQSRSNKNKTAMIKESEHRVSILPEQFDRHISLLNTPSGIVDLRNGELVPHSKEKYLTKITAIEYSSKADAPLWLQFLDEIFNGDKQLVRFMQKAVGYSITGSTKEDCAFFCYGTGRNGKSTFLYIISELLGDYAINIQPETIMVKNNTGGPTSDLARLKGARFVTTSEPNEGVRLNEGLVKQLTGGDRLTASRKYENEFEFYPEFKMWMSTNHKPVVRGTDVGIWSRIRMIPFTVRIPDEKMDRNLKHKLKQEMPGVLKWAVDGCLAWQREGLEPPDSVKKATAEYKSEMDVLTTFIDECCETSKEYTQANALFQCYLKWARDNNEYEMTSTKFGREMSKRFEKRKIVGLACYLNIAIRSAHKPYDVSFCR